jgi:hypothetical protein
MVSSPHSPSTFPELSVSIGPVARRKGFIWDETSRVRELRQVKKKDKDKDKGNDKDKDDKDKDDDKNNDDKTKDDKDKDTG